MSNPEYHQLTPNEVSTVALEPPVKPEGFAKTQSTNYFIHDCFASLGLIISAISLVYFVILDLSTVLIVLPALGLLAVSAGCLLSYLARSRSDDKKQTYATIAFCLGAVLCLTTSAIAMRVIFADNKHAGTPRFLASSSGGYTHSYPSSTTNTNSWSVNGYSYSGSSSSSSNPTYSYYYQNNQGPYSSSSSSQNQYYNGFSGSSSSSGSGPTYSFNSHSSNSGHDSSSTSTSSYSSNYYNPYYNPYAPYYEYSYGNSQDSSEESDDYTSSQNSLPNGVNVYATDSSSTYYDNEYNNGYSVYYYNGYPYYIYNGYSNSGNIYSNNQANTVYYYGPYSVSWDTYTSQYYYNSEYPYSPYNPYTSSSSSTTHGSYPRSYSEVSYAGTSDFERVFLIGLVFAQVMLFIAVIFQSNKLRGSIKEKKLLALEESFTGNQTLQI